jgi:hypothetical protein
MTNRATFVVYVDLDPDPGPFHTADIALGNLRGILERQINHYNPVVAHAPDTLQPEQEKIQQLRPISYLFPTDRMAEKVRDQIHNIIVTHRVATLKDVHKLLGGFDFWPADWSNQYSDKFGWITSDGFSIVRCVHVPYLQRSSVAYTLILPAPVQL